MAREIAAWDPLAEMTIKRLGYVVALGGLLLGASCSAAPVDPPIGSASSALEGDAYEAVRVACHGTYPNSGACMACVARVHPGGDTVAELAQGECTTQCIKTSCAIAGATCGSIDDGCGGTLSCGPPCVERKTFAVTCTQRTFTCLGPPDVITNSELDVVVDLYPERPSSPNLVTIYGSIATGTVLVSPDLSALVGQISPTAVLSPNGSLEGVNFFTPPNRFFANSLGYSVNRSAMTFSGGSVFVHRGGLTPEDPCAFSPSMSGVQKSCTGVLKP